MTLPTKVLPDAVLNKVKRSKLVYSLGRRARFRIGSALALGMWKGFRAAATIMILC